MFAAREPGEELQHLPELEVQGVRQRGRPRAAGLGSAVQIGRAGPGPDHRGDAGQSAGVARAAARVDGDAAGGWVRAAGGAGLPGRIEESFVRRLEPLSDDTRRLLLIAAAEPVGDPLLLWRAAEQLGIGSRPLSTETDGAAGDRTSAVTFRHPLVRSAVYGSAAVRGTPGGPPGAGGGDRSARRPGPAGVASGCGRGGT